jgi:PadR family transcriptional regulator PadR
MENIENTNQGTERAGAQAQLRKGVLELCVLSILSQGDAYPTDIIDKLRDARLVVVEGTLYPLLTRLKNTGFLAYRWEESTSGPPRKYYKLTLTGETLLRDLRQSWNELVDSVGQVLTKGNQHNQQSA